MEEEEGACPVLHVWQSMSLEYWPQTVHGGKYNLAWLLSIQYSWSNSVYLVSIPSQYT